MEREEFTNIMHQEATALADVERAEKLAEAFIEHWVGVGPATHADLWVAAQLVLEALTTEAMQNCIETRLRKIFTAMVGP